VSLAGFQRAFCTLIAAPDLCSALRHDPDRLPAGWDLSPRERRRILAVVRHRGMGTTCSLYRANRVTPLWTLLSRTCFLLGDAFRAEVDLHLARQRDADLQLATEVRSFAAHLRRRLAAGELASPYLREVLDYELAMHELPLSPAAHSSGHPAGHPACHPSVRAIAFDHDPKELLARLDGRLPPPYDDLPAGEFWLLADARAGRLRTLRLTAQLGRALTALDRGDFSEGAAGAAGATGTDAADLAALLDLGLAIRPL
jgi:hypothetical protein